MNFKDLARILYGKSSQERVQEKIEHSEEYRSIFNLDDPVIKNQESAENLEKTVKEEVPDIYKPVNPEKYSRNEYVQLGVETINLAISKLLTRLSSLLAKKEKTKTTEA